MNQMTTRVVWKRPSGKKPSSCWVVIYTHKHGADAWPLFGTRKPSAKSVIKTLDSWEPDKGEEIEIRGPFMFPMTDTVG